MRGLTEEFAAELLTEVLALSEEEQALWERLEEPPGAGLPNIRTDIPEKSSFTNIPDAEAWLLEQMPHLEYVNFSELGLDMVNRIVPLFAQLAALFPQESSILKAISDDPVTAYVECGVVQNAMDAWPFAQEYDGGAMGYAIHFWQQSGYNPNNVAAVVCNQGEFMFINQDGPAASWERFLADHRFVEERFGEGLSYAQDAEKDLRVMLAHEFGHVVTYHSLLCSREEGDEAGVGMAQLFLRLGVFRHTLWQAVETEARLAGKEGDLGYFRYRLEQVLSKSGAPFRAYAVLTGAGEMVADVFGCMLCAPEDRVGAREELARRVELALGRRIPFPWRRAAEGA